MCSLSMTLIIIDIDIIIDGIDIEMCENNILECVFDVRGNQHSMNNSTRGMCILTFFLSFYLLVFELVT